MKSRILLISAGAVALSAGLAIVASANHRDVQLRASLRGLNEVPPNASPATGTFRATLDETAQTITFTVDYRDLSVNPSVAHIHFGPPGINGGVMFFFCGGGGKPACPAATSGTITGTAAAADILGPVAQGIAPGDFANVVRAIRTGNSYANVHSATFPAGEIRGRVFGVGFSRDRDRDRDDDLDRDDDRDD
jgi:hypothetical protein